MRAGGDSHSHDRHAARQQRPRTRVRALEHCGGGVRQQSCDETCRPRCVLVLAFFLLLLSAAISVLRGRGLHRRLHRACRRVLRHRTRDGARHDGAPVAPVIRRERVADTGADHRLRARRAIDDVHGPAQVCRVATQHRPTHVQEVARTRATKWTVPRVGEAPRGSVIPPDAAVPECAKVTQQPLSGKAARAPIHVVAAEDRHRETHGHLVRHVAAFDHHDDIANGISGCRPHGVEWRAKSNGVAPGHIRIVPVARLLECRGGDGMHQGAHGALVVGRVAELRQQRHEAPRLDRSGVRVTACTPGQQRVVVQQQPLVLPCGVRQGHVVREHRRRHATRALRKAILAHRIRVVEQRTGLTVTPGVARHTALIEQPQQTIIGAERGLPVVQRAQRGVGHAAVQQRAHAIIVDLQAVGRREVAARGGAQRGTRGRRNEHGTQQEGVTHDGKSQLTCAMCTNVNLEQSCDVVAPCCPRSTTSSVTARVCRQMESGGVRRGSGAGGAAGAGAGACRSSTISRCCARAIASASCAFA